MAILFRDLKAFENAYASALDELLGRPDHTSADLDQIAWTFDRLKLS